MRRRCAIPAVALLCACWLSVCDSAETSRGRFGTINGYRVLHLAGTPEELGRQHGRLAGEIVRRVVKDLITDGIAADQEARQSLLKATGVMAKFQPEPFRRELKALAEAAQVAYEDLVLLQLFGDARRCITGPGSSFLCTIFAAYGPATRSGECIVGRNLDYFPDRVNRYAAMLIHYQPDEGCPFVTVTWAGIINGWTLMNSHGLVAANTTPLGGRQVNSLEGISTCFMLRKAIQFAKTVEEGVQIVQKTPRACATNMLIAGGRENPSAVMIEFDHKNLAVRRNKKGFVTAANSFCQLYEGEQFSEDRAWGRQARLIRMIRRNHGRIDRTMNFIGAESIPIASMNLHSALLFPRDLTIALAMGPIPAYKRPYKKFRMTAEGLVAGETPAGDE